MAACAIIKKCRYFQTSAGCIHGDQCVFSHDIEIASTAVVKFFDTDINGPLIANDPDPAVHLEEEMLKSQINIFAVDEKRLSGKENKYLVASNGVVTKGKCVGAKFAYDKIRSSLNCDMGRAVGVDLEGTSTLQVLTNKHVHSGL